VSLLSIQGLSKTFGGLRVIEDVNLEIPIGARHALLGPNGAGKTTLINLISGGLKPDTGSVHIGGRDCTRLSVENIVRQGVARSFQRNSSFPALTVRENLRLAGQAQLLGRWNLWRDRFAYAEPCERAVTVAQQMALEPFLDKPVSELSYGEKRQLEVALALCTRPKLLLLDEPAAGTSPSERIRLRDLIKALPSDMSIIIIEHDLDLVFEICNRITILNYGRVIAEGNQDEIKKNTEVQKAYLGNLHA
jgi:branched-chain amino acid transport system ATP-binding protein